MGRALIGSGSSHRQLRPPSGRHAIGLLEMAGEMRLIGKTGIGGYVGQRLAERKALAGASEPSHLVVAMRAGAELPAELAGDRVAVEARNVLKFAGADLREAVGVEIVADAMEAVDRPGR